VLGAAIVAAVGRAAAEPAEALTAPGQRCSEAAEQAERAWNLPAGLLGAIGRTESGRPDPVTGRIEPWPWAINAAGEGRFLDSAEAAIAAVEDLEARGIRSIDVGCFQINLMYHPDAFASLDAAFDPVANANAAAAFLTQLREKSGGWVTAIALYHSALPERGEPYRMQVLARWYGFHPPLGGAQPSLPAMRLAPIRWWSGLPRGPRRCGSTRPRAPASRRSCRAAKRAACPACSCRAKPRCAARLNALQMIGEYSWREQKPSQSWSTAGTRKSRKPMRAITAATLSRAQGRTETCYYTCEPGWS